MKKTLYCVLALLLAALFTGCLESVPTPDAEETAPAEVTPQQSAMESEISACLSALGNNVELTLCGGEEIEYIPGSEWGFAGDTWRIHEPYMPYDRLKELIASQLLPLGYTETANSFGNVYALNAGFRKIGLTLHYYDEDASSYTINLTNADEDYSAKYISEMQAEMPTVIAGNDARDAFPANFRICWTRHDDSRATLVRLDESLHLAIESASGAAEHYAAISGDSGFEYYKRTESGVTGKSDKREFEKQLNMLLDAEGSAEYPCASTWLQMCRDYLDNESDGKACTAHRISANMEKKKSVIIAGVECEVVFRDEIFSGCDEEFAFDPETGLLFRYGTEGDDNTIEYKYLVTEYTDAPASLSFFD